MERIREMLFYFLVYGYMGWMLECLYASIKEHRWIKRRGAFTQYFLPLYGLCSVLIVILFERVHESWLAAIIAGLVITFFEYLVGWGLDLQSGLRLWDYRGVWGNIKGYICIPFTIIWCGLAFVVANIVHPLLIQIHEQIPASGQWVIIGIGVIGCLSDSVMMHKHRYSDVKMG